MANEVAKELGPIAPIPVAITAFYTVPSGKRGLVTSIQLFNSHTSTVVVKIYRVPSGDAPGAANQIHEKTLTTKTDFQWEGLRVLETTGDSIRAEADVASVVNIEIDGVEEDQ